MLPFSAFGSLMLVRLSITFVSAAALVAVATCFRAESRGASVSSIKSLIEQAHILSAHYQVHPHVSGSEVIVVTYRNPKATENDNKIEAVLIAKTIFERYPQFNLVRSQFCDVTNNRLRRTVAVTDKDVVSFARGDITKDQLLASLSATHIACAPGAASQFSGENYNQITSNYQVVPGFAHSHRSNLLGLLMKIQTCGGDMTKYWGPFLAIEDRVRRGEDGDVIRACNSLSGTATAELAQMEQQRKSQEEVLSATKRLVTKDSLYRPEPQDSAAR